MDPENIEVKHNGHKPIDIGSIGDAFSQPQGWGSVKYLVEVGKDPASLMLRTDIPDKVTEGNVRATAISIEISRDEEFGEGGKDVTRRLALWPSAGGKRANMLLEAITGEFNKHNKFSFTDKVKNFAFGNNKPPAE